MLTPFPASDLPRPARGPGAVLRPRAQQPCDPQRWWPRQQGRHQQHRATAIFGERIHRARDSPYW